MTTVAGPWQDGQLRVTARPRGPGSSPRRRTRWSRIRRTASAADGSPFIARGHSAAWSASSRASKAEAFDSRQVNERANIAVVERQLRTDWQHPEDEIVLAQFFVESQAEAFDSRQVNERANIAVVERQLRTDPDGSEYLRYVMSCPRCSNRRVLRQDKIDAALAEIYEQGAVEKVCRLPL
jgi:hypothetical protein